MMPTYKFVGWEDAPAYTTATGKKVAKYLLWGDRVEVVANAGQRTEVYARGRNRSVFVDSSALNGEALLEFYFIDVGQGDGTLIVTPDRQHILIDGGYPRDRQNTGKSAADFVDWKFFNDYRKDEIALDAMICSHNDLDHYGGLDDLLDVEQSNELDCASIAIEKFYHAGLSWWRSPSKKRFLGTTAKVGSKTYYVDLLTSRASATRGLKNTANPRLQGMWADFIAKVVKAKTKANRATPFERLSQNAGDLDEFNTDDLKFTVLGPVEKTTPRGPGLRRLSGGTSQNTNGHSTLVRIDYGRARILLTGDLNKRSQHLLLAEYEGRETEFAADVAKACHHGSEDVSFEFLNAIKPAVTIISSGDGEGHDHPRPAIIGASGVSGFFSIKDDEILTPLVYATELARSVSIGEATKLEVPRTGGGNDAVSGGRMKRTRIHFSEQKPGALRPVRKSRTLGDTGVVAGQVYGLVNVRTDGKKVLCATMNEGNGSWQIKTFGARF